MPAHRSNPARYYSLADSLIDATIGFVLGVVGATLAWGATLYALYG